MTACFGPQTGNAAISLPTGAERQRYGTAQTWVRDASAPGRNDGTVLDAAFFNRIIGNLEYVLSQSGVTAVPGDMTALYRGLIGAVSNGAPALLDSINELAAAINEDPAFAVTMMTALNNRVRFDAAQLLNSTQRAQALANLGVILGTGPSNVVQLDPVTAKLPALDGSQLLGIVLASQLGTTANKVVQLDSSAKLPAVDGSNLFNVTTQSLKNAVLNGAMMVSQEKGSAAVTADNQYPVDQFNTRVQTAGSGAFAAAQVVKPTPGGSPNRIRVTVTAAQAVVGANDYMHLSTKIEGYRAAGFRLGAATAKPVTVQFGVNAPAGVYSVVLQNNLGNRSYVAEYTVISGEALSDVVKSVTIPGDVIGTWEIGSLTGLTVRFGLMAGASTTQTVNAWGTANARGSANQFNLFGTNGNVFELFDVGVYAGLSAPPFVAPDFISELALCKRYWEKSYDYATAPGTITYVGVLEIANNTGNTNVNAWPVRFEVEKRGTPNIIGYSPVSGAQGFWYDNGNGVDVAATLYRTPAGTKGFTPMLNVSPSSVPRAVLHYVSDARL